MENGYEATQSELKHKPFCVVFASSGNRCDCGSLDKAQGKLSEGARAYLKTVWECDSIKEVNYFTASIILENVREANPEWHYDAEIWEAFAALHNIRVDIPFPAFYHYYVAGLN